MRFAVAVVPLVAVLLGSGCPEPEPELEPAPDCSAQTPGDTSMLPQRELQIGENVDGTFTPWADGQQVMAVYGFQGFPMVTPWFELPAEASDADGDCWHVLYQHLDADGNVVEDEGEGTYSYGLVFSRVGDVMRTGPLFDPSYSGDGATLRLRATVSTPKFVAVDEVSIVLAF
jgi:hypothetical protein